MSQQDFSADLEGLCFKLGNKVKDVVTGIEGTATAVVINLSTVRQVCIQLKRDIGGVESWYIDIINVDKVGDGFVDRATPYKYATEVDFDLGDKVRDKLTKTEGHVTARIYSFNGCISYKVMVVTKEGEVVSAEIDQRRLKKIKSSSLSVTRAREKFIEGPMASRADNVRKI